MALLDMVVILACLKILYGFFVYKVKVDGDGIELNTLKQGWSLKIIRTLKELNPVVYLAVRNGLKLHQLAFLNEKLQEEIYM